MTAQQGNVVPKQAGVLPIRPAQAHAQTSSPVDAPKSAKAKAAAQDGVKIKIRRLPPGLTEQEFVATLGDVWKAGNGKVGWFEYHAGHIPKSASKESTPAFALLQVKEDDIDELSQVVQNAIWEDAKGTFSSPSLVGPPCIERSMYKKLPLGKPKKDPKEGTIDQDEDYMAFLASLAEDPTMKQNLDELNAEETTEPESETKATTTPLVQAILENREKRANKVKEAASSKSSKHARQESQGAKGKASASSPEESKKKSKEKGSERPKETVRILRKQTATEAAAEAAKAVAKDIKLGASASDVASSRRAGIQGVANILRRDLGLSSGSAARKARQEMAKQEGTKKIETDTKGKDTKGKENGSSSAATGSTQAPERPPTPTAPKAQAEKSSRSGRSRRGKEPKAAEPKAGGNSEAPATAPKAPVILQKKKEDSTASSSTKDQTSASKPASKPTASSAAPTPPTGPKAASAKGNQAQKKSNNPGPTSGATRAFLKHANPSQGVTEALLNEAMQVFGGVSFVEIDRRKGFAYVDFADHEGLTKAMAASPVTVAQATVQVLERKEQSKKTTTAPSNAAPNPAQAGAASSTSAAVAPSKPPAALLSNTDKSGNAASGEQQQPKRSRRRGRGRGGNGGGGGGGNAEGKSADQGSSGGVGASTPAAGSTSNG